MQMGKWVSRLLSLWSPGVKPAVAPAAAPAVSWVWRSASCVVWRERTEALVRLVRRRSRRQVAWICLFIAILCCLSGCPAVRSRRVLVSGPSYSCFYGACWGGGGAKPPPLCPNSFPRRWRRQKGGRDKREQSDREQGCVTLSQQRCGQGAGQTGPQTHTSSQPPGKHFP